VQLPSPALSMGRRQRLPARGRRGTKRPQTSSVREKRLPEVQAVYRPLDVESHEDTTGHNENKPAGQGRRAIRPTQDRVLSCEMFLFFSGRLGCLASLLISAALTILLYLIFTR
jgi:hypothetical protein